MFTIRKLMVFLVVALLGGAFCRAAEKAAPAKVVKPPAAAAACTRRTAWIELGFFPPVQFPCENTEINGFRFAAIYTYNKAINGLDIGLLCDSGNANGLQIAVANRTAGIMNGLSLGLINVAEEEMNGVQIGGFVNQAGSDSLDNAGARYTTSYGWQCGFINCADSIFRGFQLGMVNISNTIFKGLQLGFINLSSPPSDVFADFQSEKFKAEKKKRSCVQIGFLNFNPNGVFPVTLLINF
ncbi:MAG: hypothetical protein PHH77_06580 [Victivallaceae bacterium]|nr:hypothetical protein [Victivallaceae bacterium]